MSNAPQTDRIALDLAAIDRMYALYPNLSREISTKVIRLLAPCIIQAWTTQHGSYIAAADDRGHVLAYFRKTYIQITPNAPILDSDLVGLDVEELILKTRARDWVHRNVRLPEYVPTSLPFKNFRKALDMEVCPDCNTTKSRTGNCWC